MSLVHAAEPPAAAPNSEPSAAEAPAEPLPEAARRSARSTAEWLARGVDSWFGDRPFSEGGKVSDGQLSVRLLKREDDSAQLALRFNARFRLPNLERNAYAFIGRDDQQELVRDKPNSFTNEQLLLRNRATDNRFFAGLGLRTNERVDLRLGLRGGLKLYAQARYRHQWQVGERGLAEFRETLFWTPGDRLGSTTAASYERALSPTLALRWLNAATITQSSKKFEWSSSLGAYRSFGAQRLLSLEALISGLQGSGVPVDDYGLQLKWAQPVHKDWLIGEVIVGHFWPRHSLAEPRGRAWALGGSLLMKF